jgi:CRISPR/Cas system endoribonuclease Cas6 (RAMP superfamily)
MIADNLFLLPQWPEALQQVDIVKARFDLEFTSPCQVQPADFLGIGRRLRVAARQTFDANDIAAVREWQRLFQPALSDDPVARRKFQKPAPAFVVTMPIMQEKLFTVGDRLELEVLFIGNGVPLIHDFLRSLLQLGRLGLVNGEGSFEVTEVYHRHADHSTCLAWCQSDPLESLACAVQPLTWVLQQQSVTRKIIVKYLTPTRLMVDGKPLRKPSFLQVFPFMLRRVTSMLHAHCGIEVLDEPEQILEVARELELLDVQHRWQDWRMLSTSQGMAIGGFVGEMTIAGRALEELYWVLAVASLFAIGKGATYGAGRFELSS